MANILILFLSLLPQSFGTSMPHTTEDDLPALEGYYTSEIAVRHLLRTTPPDLIIPIVSAEAKTPRSTQTLPAGMVAEMQAVPAEGVSALSYFEDVVRRHCPAGHSCVVRPCALPDAGEPNGGSRTQPNDQIKALQEMDNVITDWRKSHPADDCYTYVDLTGGKRDAAMLLTAALRFLQSKGYNTKSVLYADLDRAGQPPCCLQRAVRDV